jgi:hypothetical protein
MDSRDHHEARNGMMNDPSDRTGLFVNETCQWPECKSADERFDDFEAFVFMHLNVDHVAHNEQTLSDLAVQKRKVEAAEANLQREKLLFQSMQAHVQFVSVDTVESDQVKESVDAVEKSLTTPESHTLAKKMNGKSKEISLKLLQDGKSIINNILVYLLRK